MSVVAAHAEKLSRALWESTSSQGEAVIRHDSVQGESAGRWGQYRSLVTLQQGRSKL